MTMVLGVGAPMCPAIVFASPNRQAEVMWKIAQAASATYQHPGTRRG